MLILIEVIVAMPILTAFTEAALREAVYKILDDGTFYGEIPLCAGVWANEKTLEKCREVLHEVLEEWLILKEFQKMNGINNANC